MDWTKAMEYAKEYAEKLRTEKGDPKQRLAYYYYGLICLSNRDDTKEDAETALEIQYMQKAISALGYSDLKKYASDFKERIFLEPDVENLETADKFLAEAERLAQICKHSMATYHFLIIVQQGEHEFVKNAFIEQIEMLKAKKQVGYRILLHVFDGKDKIGLLSLDGTYGELTIGRKKDCDIILDFPDVSRKHACFRLTDSECAGLSDSGSKFGTFINEKKIDSKNGYARVYDGDCLRFAEDTKIYIQILELSKVSNKKCELCGKSFVTSNQDDEFCVDCRKELSEEMRIMPERELEYESTIKNIFFAMRNAAAEAIRAQIEWYGDGKKKVLWNPEQQIKRKADMHDLGELLEDPKFFDEDVDFPKEEPPKPVFMQGDIIPGYRLVKKLGEGGMGIVYLAEERASKKLFGVKMVRKELLTKSQFVDKFVRESKLHMQYDHRNVAKIYDVGEYNGAPYILMEYYSNGTLSQYYEKIKNSPLKYELTRQLFIQILTGLDYLHHAEVKVKLQDGSEKTFHGIVHRDLKPDNIFVSYDSSGNVVLKIADFGMAKSFEAAGLSGNTITGSWGGTMAFMPRQQIIDFKYCKPDVDIWAAAASIYYMMTKYPPKKLKLGVQAAAAIVNGSAIPIRNRDRKIPKEFAEIIDRALVDEELYYKNASDLIRDLEKIRC